jgi:hypothetical protein
MGDAHYAGPVGVLNGHGSILCRKYCTDPF